MLMIGNANIKNTILRGILMKSESESSSVKSDSLHGLYTVHGILSARILEWVAFPFSRGSSHPEDRTQISHTEGDSLPAEPQGKLLNCSYWA